VLWKEGGGKFGFETLDPARLKPYSHPGILADRSKARLANTHLTILRAAIKEGHEYHI
jgi:hypothetical protein